MQTIDPKAQHEPKSDAPKADAPKADAPVLVMPPDGRAVPDAGALAYFTEHPREADPIGVAAYLTEHGRELTPKRLRTIVRDNAQAVIGRAWPRGRTVHAYTPITAARVVTVAQATGADPADRL